MRTQRKRIFTLAGVLFPCIGLGAMGASPNQISHQSAAPAVTAPAAPASSSQPENVIACRALEAHTSEQPPVTVVVFHQRDKQDQARLAVLLKENSNGPAEIQGNDGKWHSVTVARLKSCFGRGLLLLPAGAEQPKQGQDFLLRFPVKNQR